MARILQIGTRDRELKRRHPLLLEDMDFAAASRNLPPQKPGGGLFHLTGALDFVPVLSSSQSTALVQESNDEVKHIEDSGSRTPAFSILRAQAAQVTCTVFCLPLLFSQV